ncbi:MAG TPA: hypothetical protein VF153_04425 [Candidatus Limnocylindria bacterium]
MSRRNRLLVAALVLAGVLCGLALILFAASACPADLPTQPCPGAGTNRVVVIGLSALTLGLLVAPFAFLGEFVLRRRIVYRGAWRRAARRAVLVAIVAVVLAGLRLGGALSVPVALFAILLAAAAEWFAVRRFDGP